MRSLAGSNALPANTPAEKRIATSESRQWCAEPGSTLARSRGGKLRVRFTRFSFANPALPNPVSFGLFVVLATLTLASAAFAQVQPHGRDLTTIGPEELMTIEVETVHGASRHTQKVTQAPASITIVTSEEIQKYGYRTLADILRHVRGFYITNDRNYEYVGLRGFARPGDYNTNILLLLDGHRVNENVYEMAPVGTDFPLDVDLIERVEIIRGPSSSVYGTNAFFGAVNVITKRGESLKRTEISTEGASLGTGKARVTYGNKFKSGLDVLVSGTLYASHGQRRVYFPEFDDPSSNNGVAENADDDQFRDFLANVSYRNFTLQALYGYRDKRIPTASFDTVFNDPRTRTSDAHGYLDLTYERTLGGQWGVLGRLYYDQYTYDGTYIYDYSDSPPPFLVASMDFGQGKWWGTELKLTKPVGQKHRLTWGTEYRDNLHQDQRVYDQDPFFLYLDDHRSSRLWALHFQDELAVHNKLLLNFGVRHDHYSTFGGATSPRLGLIFSPREKSTLKFLYGEAFRAPNTFETYYRTSSYKINPDLKPERIRTFEAVWEQYLGRRFRMSATGFYYQVKSLIGLQLDPIDGMFVYGNLNRVNTGGLELELEKKWAWGLESRFGYAFQDAEDQVTGRHLTNSPKHLGTVHVSMPLLKKKLCASLAGHLVSRRQTLQGNYSGAHFIPSLTLLGRNLGKRWEVSASVYNLVNQKYADPAGEEHRQDVIPQDGRSFRLKIVYRF